MAEYIGFAAIVENVYDAGRISSVDEPVAAAGILMNMSPHIGAYIEDVMVQYAQPRPWILLETSNNYVSSAMPQVERWHDCVKRRVIHSWSELDAV